MATVLIRIAWTERRSQDGKILAKQFVHLGMKLLRSRAKLL